jgi:hypothetical protein
MKYDHIKQTIKLTSDNIKQISQHIEKFVIMSSIGKDIVFKNSCNFSKKVNFGLLFVQTPEQMFVIK